MVPLVVALRVALRRGADRGRAPEMQAYMKSKMPFWGVASPERRRIQSAVFARHPLGDAPSFERAVTELWDGASHREERYAAIDLLLAPRHRRFLGPKSLPLIEHMIVSGGWWDYVDPLASHALGHLLSQDPDGIRQRLLAWSRSRNIWKRRASILAQLRFRANTDRDLLYACIEPSLGKKEFFLQKAIGWALRQYAWTAPLEVKRYVKKNSARISALSKREAMKNLR
jgi:3-methyladenine DNA glycosylase AlkD